MVGNTLLFGEVFSIIFVAVTPENKEKFEDYLEQELSKNWQQIEVLKDNLFTISTNNHSLIVANSTN